jgi:NAD(P)-dependent dehydrogenase (short-subunit alcohol dehydrogenase family)
MCRVADAGAATFCASRQPSPDYARRGVRYIPLDVTSDDTSALVNALPETLHGIVYCPGTITLKPFTSLKEEDFRHDLDVNLLGAVRVLRACQKKLFAAGGASVVLFSTVAARTGMSFHASVAAAKAAVEGMAVSLAAEWSRSKVRVNVIAPSLTDTPLAEGLLADDKRRSASAERHPLKRIGQPDDAAAAACFLLSDESSWITGQVLAVDGGLSRLRPL